MKKTKLKISAILRVLFAKYYFVIVDLKAGESSAYAGVMSTGIEDVILKFAVEIAGKRNIPTKENVEADIAKLKKHMRKQMGKLFSEKDFEQAAAQYREQFKATS